MRISDLWLISIAACAAACARAPQPLARPPKEPAVTAPSESHLAAHLPVRTGDVHDFDFLAGAWTIHNRTLKPGSEEWVEFPATTCMTLHLGGVVNVDEYQFPTKGYSAIALRTFHLEKRQWSIYWVENRVGLLLPPVVGGFDGDRGEFYGEDEIAGQPAIFRFVWNKLGTDRARWEQAYSRDGQKWTINWVMDFTRAGRAACPRT
jgi:hypothetical protein